jgi:hypothetical protein
MAKIILIFNLDDMSIPDMVSEIIEEGDSATYVYESVVDDINDGDFEFAILEDEGMEAILNDGDLTTLTVIHKGGKLRSR